MKRVLHPILFVLAAVLVFEEWLWDALKAQVRRLSHLPVFAAFERALKRLGPWGSLAVLVLPALVLLPFKFAALWALSHGHALLGVAVLLSAKLAGTACAAYLFDLVRDNARKLAWFNALYNRVTDLFRSAKDWLHAQPAYQAARAQAGAIRTALRERFSRKTRMARKLNAAKALARRSQQ